ncbi:transporter substrate-binding domain-containing protein [Marinobacter sp. CHS3-4]|uniref:substrate-binding periplasmic protein n=1 Tax=Marinobacter sp. CHS3-4 TaxID=3045174 RepID=UPI0024B62FFD|nr:transporter substrate-binding domain-containing protein [Marinobacter sp. CHS3-4]MDI9244167.1 transporter substrate-binding domain-containing protein [Marinobacter sp. CHS3-4]
MPGSQAAEPDSASVAAGNVADKRVVLVADPWCPHNCKAGAAKEGYMIDIAREVFESAGYTLEYRNFSWARALRMTRKGAFNGVVGAFRSDAPDFIFPDISQGRAAIALFTHPDNDWTYDGLPSLQNQRLLAINGYSYTAELDNYIEQNLENRERIWILSGGSPLKRALKLLDRDRTDVFAEDEYVMNWAIKNEPDMLSPRHAGRISDTQSYVAFSPALDNSVELAQLLSEGTQKLIDSGRMEAILNTYGLTELPETP